MELAEIIGAGAGGPIALGLLWRFVTLEVKAKQIPTLIKTVNNMGIQLEHVNTKVEDIWDIFLDEGRSKRRDLRVYESAPRLSDEGKGLVPEDLKQAILEEKDNERGNANCDLPQHELISRLKKRFGLERLVKEALEREMSLQEYLALLADYDT